MSRVRVELCVRVVYVSESCVSKLCVSKMCVNELCVSVCV